MSKNKGFTYISILLVFLILSSMTWNLFFLIKNFKEQGKILDKNIEVFYTSSSLSKEALFSKEDYKEVEKENILYIVEKTKGDLIEKTTVSAYQKDTLLKKISRYKYLPPEVAYEDFH